MSVGAKIEYRITLRCGHERIFKFHLPAIGERLYCPRCGGYRPVSARHGPHRWNCNICKAHGTAQSVRVRATRGAQKHANAYGHDVAVYREAGDGREDEITIRSQNTDSLPF